MHIKIGELARHAGLTVRTLHYYDTIGLLSPSARSETGARLYDEHDKARLQHIQALKQFGCSLSLIRTFVTDTTKTPLIEVVTRQLALLDRQIENITLQRNRLSRLQEQLSLGDAPTADLPDWLSLLEVMTMYEQRFSESERNVLQRNKAIGTLDRDWKKLIAHVRSLLDRGVSADDELAGEAALRWMRLVMEATGNTPDLALKLQSLYKEEPKAQILAGISPEMMGFVEEALSRTRIRLLGKFLSPDDVRKVCTCLRENRCRWLSMIVALQRMIACETAPDHTEAQRLIQRWTMLFHDECANRCSASMADIQAAFFELPDLAISFGLDASMIAFMRNAARVAHNSQVVDEDRRCTGDQSTALRVAQMRAVHQLVDSPLVFHDPYAVQILGPQAVDALQQSLSRCDEPLYKGLRASVAVRSRFAEDQWTTAYREGVRQYVILGAGLDTFAFRNPKGNDVRIFELDLPTTQRWKREQLRSVGLLPPANLVFVEMDFEHQSLDRELHRAGFRRDQPAFFSWLGVSMYLDRDALETTLRSIAAGAPGSSVVFDYAVDPALLSPRERKAFDVLVTKTAAIAEPWKSHFHPESLAALLHSLGFQSLRDFGPDQLNARYFSERTDGLRKSGVTRLVVARVEEEKLHG